MWTHFWDMHSGGGQKEEFAHAYIEAPEKEAKSIFYARFGHNPECVTCTCCGPDYVITEYETLEEATHFERVESVLSRRKDNPITLEAFVKFSHILVIASDEIKDSERSVDVPEEGYVWH